MKFNVCVTRAESATIAVSNYFIFRLPGNFSVVESGGLTKPMTSTTALYERAHFITPCNPAKQTT